MNFPPTPGPPCLTVRQVMTPQAGEGEIAKFEVWRALCARQTSNFEYLPPFPKRGGGKGGQGDG
jgi:hypothetical protein